MDDKQTKMDQVAVAVSNPEEAEIATMSCKDFCVNLKQSLAARSGKDWGITFARVTGLVASLYFFLFSLDLMGNAFKVLGGCSAGNMFSGIDNPIAGLMIGIIATVLVQSSSTSTSIVVALVGAGQISVQNAIPVVMGANIGTSVTNTIVSIGQINDLNQFERAFAGATVHDMFNFLSVIVFLPLEIATGFLYQLTKTMTPDEMGEKGEKWVGPIKAWVGPLSKQVLAVNKKLFEQSAVEAATTGSSEMCTAAYADPEKKGIILGGLFYAKDHTLNDDLASGGVCLFISLFLLCFCLFVLVKILQSMVMNTSKEMLQRATTLNPYVAMVLGCGITILVQSSSITTSVLTPLVGIGVIKLENMFPLTLGANVGTTCTGMLAAMVGTKSDAVQIALCHLFFNICGILLWYPIPFMRQFPLRGARALGKATRHYRAFPLFYILFAFVIVPLVFLGISTLYAAGTGYTALAAILTVFIVVAAIYFFVWVKFRGGKEWIMSTLSSKQERSDVMKDLPKTIKQLLSDVEMLKKSSTPMPSDNRKESNDIEIAPAMPLLV